MASFAHSDHSPSQLIFQFLGTSASMVRYTSILSVVALSDIQPTHTHTTQTHTTQTLSGFTHSTYHKKSQKQPNRINVMALGDWGAPLDVANLVEAQKSVATIMGLWAKSKGAFHVLDLGDSLYYQGTRPLNVDYRMKDSFVGPYKELHAQQVHWSGVYGNHDVGQGAPLCISIDNEENSNNPTRIVCNTPAEVVAALQDLIEGQRIYHTYNELWHEKKNFYTEAFTTDDLVVDLYYVDMNSIMSMGKSGICCQCELPEGNVWRYCQSETKDPCAAKPDVVKACVDLLDEWEQKSYAMVKEIACASKAHHKVLVSHYSVLLHMDEPFMRSRWLKLLKNCGITLSISGHTHAMAEHVYDDISFLTSGNGGGLAIQLVPEPIVGRTVWKHDKPQSFGFLALSFTKTEITAEFVVVDADSKEGYEVIRTVTIPRTAHDAPFSSKNASNLQFS